MPAIAAVIGEVRKFLTRSAYELKTLSSPMTIAPDA
jgi:hypothetical protein